MKVAARDAASRTQLGTGPSMTPMVDVVLVILIFFMASAAFMTPEWLLGVGLAQREGQGSEPDPFAMPTPRFVVEIDAADDGTPVATGLGLDRAPLDELSGRVASLLTTVASDELVLILQPSDRVAYEAVVRARELCEQGGATRVVLR